MAREKRDTVATQIRLPADIHEYIKTEATKMGIPQNAMLVMLLDRGRKWWESDIKLCSESE